MKVENDGCGHEEAEVNGKQDGESGGQNVMADEKKDEESLEA